MAIPTVSTRPARLDGCWQSWREARQPQIIRSEMESGAVKVRRRFTGRRRMAEVSVTLKAEFYQDFVDWFEVTCLAGVNATQMKDPLGNEQAWRFTAPPEIEWLEPVAFRATATIERNELWP